MSARSDDRRTSSTTAWHSLPSEAVLQTLNVDPGTGLDTADARRRRRQYGLNQLRSIPRKSLFRILLDQLRSLITLLLAAAAVAAFAYGHLTEATAITGVIVLNSLIGFVTELRAVRSMEALRTLGVVLVNVRRHGRIAAIPARGLVPGDIVELEAGDVASADMRVIESSKLKCNEAILTGESLPVGKGTDALEQDTPLADRSSMLHMGTALTRGTAIGVVTGTGSNTELGRIASLLELAESGSTPLEKRIDQLSRQLMWVALGCAGVIGATGIASGRDTLLMIESAIALAVATVPEGLPMVATLALARGMWRMARRQALIERLSAVETLGATTVILTDKTGTLTENRMAVTRLLLATGREVSLPSPETESDRGNGPPEASEQALLDQLLTAAVLCNNASLAGGDPIGDPMEVALLELAGKLGVEPAQLIERLPEVEEHSFDPDTKMMATVHQQADGEYLYAIKGAPEAVLKALEERTATDTDPQPDWSRTEDELARSGLRLLALAGKTSPLATENPYENLNLYGLVGLADPPREDVADAIRSCQAAGVRVVMVTGDHAATARNIGMATGVVEDEHASVIEGTALNAKDTNLPEAPIFARVTPAQKLSIISAFQDRGEVVAMMGDGVNDAPALKQADIGIAMGQRGSQVAREAADMILLDDRFSTIIGAIAQGRVIFENIRKFVIYLMSCNLSELLTIALASFSGAPLPLLPLQILYLNLVTDVFPAFALGAGEGDPGIMKKGPRPTDEPLLATRHWLDLVLGATFITAATLIAFALSLTVYELTAAEAVTCAFLTLALAQLWHVFNMRSRGSHWLHNEITRNRYIWSAIGLCLFLVVAPVYFGPMADLLGLTPPPAYALTAAVSLSFAPLLSGQLLLLLRKPST